MMKIFFHNAKPVSIVIKKTTTTMYIAESEKASANINLTMKGRLVMSNHKSISKKIRLEVYEKCNYKCSYSLPWLYPYGVDRLQQNAQKTLEEIAEQVVAILDPTKHAYTFDEYLILLQDIRDGIASGKPEKYILYLALAQTV